MIWTAIEWISSDLVLWQGDGCYIYLLDLYCSGLLAVISSNNLYNAILLLFDVNTL